MLSVTSYLSELWKSPLAFATSRNWSEYLIVGLLFWNVLTVHVVIQAARISQSLFTLALKHLALVGVFVFLIVFYRLVVTIWSFTGYVGLIIFVALVLGILLVVHYSLLKRAKETIMLDQTQGDSFNLLVEMTGKEKYSLFLVLCYSLLIMFLGLSLASGPTIQRTGFCSTFRVIVYLSDSFGWRPQSYCTGPASIVFVGAVSTGKTSVISLLLGQTYKGGDIDPNAATDKFTCVALGAGAREHLSFSSPDRKKCCLLDELVDKRREEVLLGQTDCKDEQKMVDFVGESTSKLDGMVLLDTPGYQHAYRGIQNCAHRKFYQDLAAYADLIVLVWRPGNAELDGIIEILKGKVLEIDYVIIMNHQIEGEQGRSKNHGKLQEFYRNNLTQTSEQVKYTNFHFCALLAENPNSCETKCPDLSSCPTLQSDVESFKQYLVDLLARSSTNARSIWNKRLGVIKHVLTGVCYNTTGLSSLWKILSSLALMNSVDGEWPLIWITNWFLLAGFCFGMFKYCSLLCARLLFKERCVGKANESAQNQEEKSPPSRSKGRSRSSEDRNPSKIRRSRSRARK